MRQIGSGPWSRDYGAADFHFIADALRLPGITARDQSDHTVAFRRAAFWYQSMQSYREAIPDRSFVKRLMAIANAADRAGGHGCGLLKRLGEELPECCKPLSEDDLRYRPGSYAKAVASLDRKLTIDPEAIEDGIRDTRIANALARPAADRGETLEQILIKLHSFEQDCRSSVAAALELRDRARLASDEVEFVRQRLKRSPDTSDAALSGWVDDMLSLYVEITSREIAISKIKDGEPDAGKPSGPLIRFLMAAGKPLGIELSPGSLARKIQTALERHAQKKQQPCISNDA